MAPETRKALVVPHRVLALSWPRFFGATTLAFLAINALYAVLYRLSPASVQNAKGLVDCFFFSVETITTIGHGEMSPQTSWGHALAVTEALGGILFSAIVTGLTFARFAGPEPRIRFPDALEIALRDGKPHLMLRMANERGTTVVDATLNLLVLMAEATKEGETLRRPMRLELASDKNPMFALDWTAMHPIDERSPLYGDDAMDRLRAARAEIFVTLSGLDETLMHPIVARYRYRLHDIVKLGEGQS